MNLYKRHHTMLSRIMTLVLTEKHEEINIKPDENGWVRINELLDAINAYGRTISFETLETILETKHKVRFLVNEEKTLIRANPDYHGEMEQF